MLGIFGFMFFAAIFTERDRKGTDLDLIQLERKIQNGEIKELRIQENRIEATDRNGSTYAITATNDSTRDEILNQARKADVNGRPAVERVEENTSASPVNPIFPAGFVVLFGAHMLKILLSLALMPLYIILAVKDERHDETTRIIWVVLIATLGMLAMPVYWYLYIWRKQSEPTTPTETAI
jgi:hypothetical protein